jgi:predicted dehydrogenase
MIAAAIVGLGRWGRLLVESVQGRSEAIRFVAGVARTPARAEAFARAQGFAVGDDLDAVLDDAAIDALVLATPHSQHGDQIIRAARAGKHVFSEKPLALTRASAEAAIDACQAAGVAVGLGHNRRFLPNTVALKRLIDDGALGRLLHAEGNFSMNLAHFADAWRAEPSESPAGGMTSLGIHALDALIHLCGPIAEIDARSVRRALPFDVDDATSALLSFASGMTGYLGTVAATGQLWHVRVFGADGWAEIRGLDTLSHMPLDGPEQTMSFAPFDSIRAELEYFAAAAAGGAPFPITPAEMIHGIAVMEAVERSARAGRPVAIA